MNCGNLLAYGIILLLISSALGFTIYQISRPNEPVIFLSTTTSVENTGLLDYLITAFEKTHNYTVKYTAVGSGAAIQLARDGEVDAVLVHAPDLEKKLILDDYSDQRHTLWYNYFSIVGPEGDPANVSQASDAVQAFERIYRAGNASRATFFSRGDQSGTNLKELEIWNATKYTINPKFSWYYATGTGMSATLTASDSRSDSYVLTDAGTFATVQASSSAIDKQILFGQDPMLYNPYSYLIINSTTTGTTLNTAGAQVFLNFLDDPATDQLVLNYRVGDTILFHPIGT